MERHCVIHHSVFIESVQQLRAMSSSTRREQEIGNTQHQHRATIRAIDETKEGINRAIEELKRETPRHLQTITDFQNQTADATKEIADNFLESQKEVINSMQTSWAPIAQRTGDYWRTGVMPLSPLDTADFYARSMGATTETYVASARLAANLVSIGVEVATAATKYGRHTAKGAADIISNTARTFAQTTKETVQVHEQELRGASTETATSYPSKDTAALSGESSSARAGTSADTENTTGSTEKTRKK